MSKKDARRYTRANHEATKVQSAATKPQRPDARLGAQRFFIL